MLASLKRSLLNHRLTVYWPDDDAWYCGSVVGFEPKEATHAVLYDDGVTESLNIAEE